MTPVILVILGLFVILSLLPNQKYLPKIPTAFVVILVIGTIIGIYLTPDGFDKHQYRMMFERPNMWNLKDLGWETYNSFWRLIFGKKSDLYFLANSILYTLLFVFFAYKTFDKEYVFYYLLLVFISLGFDSGGTNVIRTGISTAIMFAAFTQRRNVFIFALLSIVAAYIHLSSSLLALSFLLSYYVPKLRIYFGIWIAFLVLSYFDALSFVLNNTVDFIGDTDERLRNYSSQIGGRDDFYKNMGWRVDFVIYSVIPVIFMYIYLIKNKISDRFYSAVCGTYFICNSFWLCVIRMPYTDRVALLSWVLIPIVTIYPALKYKKIHNRNLLAAAAYCVPIALKTYYLFR